MTHRYTPLTPNPFALNLSNEAKDFQKYLRSTSNVYYDPTIPDEQDQKLDSLKRGIKDVDDSLNVSSNYEYYSSIPVGSNLTSQNRGWNYSNRDNEFLHTDSPQWLHSQTVQPAQVPNWPK